MFEHCFYGHNCPCLNSVVDYNACCATIWLFNFHLGNRRLRRRSTCFTEGSSGSLYSWLSGCSWGKIHYDNFKKLFDLLHCILSIFILFYYTLLMKLLFFSNKFTFLQSWFPDLLSYCSTKCLKNLSANYILYILIFFTYYSLLLFVNLTCTLIFSLHFFNIWSIICQANNFSAFLFTESSLCIILCLLESATRVGKGYI